jgi:hypothetical protein
MQAMSRRLVPTLLLALALSLSLAASVGCAGTPDEASAPGSDDFAPGTVPDPGTGTDGTPRQMAYAGRYQLTSTIDAAGAGLFGDTISATLVDLSNFHENPAGTILDLLAVYQVPGYTEVWDALPGFLKDELEGWLNEYLFQALFEAVPAIDQAVQVVDDLATVSRNVEMRSELVLRGPGDAGDMTGTHTITGLGFTLWDQHAFIPLPAQVEQVAQIPVHATVTPRFTAGGPQALLQLDRQDFGIRYGDMIMDALAQLVFAPRGATDLAGYLNQVIDCQAVASWLGDRCLLGACVSDFVSVSSLAALCTGGLDLLGNAAESAVRSLKFDVLDLADGKCLLYDKGEDDAIGDYKISALTDGAWDTTITVGGVQQRVMAPFQGKRLADE